MNDLGDADVQIFILIVAAMAYVGAAAGFYSVLEEVHLNMAKKYTSWQVQFGRVTVAMCWPAIAAYVWAKEYLGRR
jgi:uncharacterized membrane protein